MSDTTIDQPSDSSENSKKRSRKRGRVSFSSDIFAEETSLQSLPDGGSTQRRISLNELAHNPRNPRYGYEDSETHDLASSLREHGQLQPATVVARDVYLSHYPEDADHLGSAPWVVLIGNRRLAAARLAEFTHLVVTVEDRLGGADPMLAEATLVENIHRQDLPPLLEARELQGLVERHGSQSKAAQRVAKTQGWVSQRLALLKLVPELQEQLRDGRMSVREARSIASLPPEDQQDGLARMRSKSDAVSPSDSTAEDAESGVAGSSSEHAEAEPNEDDRKRPDVGRIAQRLRRQLSDDEIAELVRALAAPGSS